MVQERFGGKGTFRGTRIFPNSSTHLFPILDAIEQPSVCTARQKFLDSTNSAAPHDLYSVICTDKKMSEA